MNTTESLPVWNAPLSAADIGLWGRAGRRVRQGRASRGTGAALSGQVAGEACVKGGTGQRAEGSRECQDERLPADANAAIWCVEEGSRTEGPGRAQQEGREGGEAGVKVPAWSLNLILSGTPGQ